MEILTNCNIIINIELIELESGGNQKFEIVFITKDKEKYKLTQLSHPKNGLEP